MGAAKFSVPDGAQVQLLRQCDIDPEGYVVVLENDEVLWVRHLKTRNDVSIMKNRGYLKNNGYQ